jgi:lysozyme family protein
MKDNFESSLKNVLVHEGGWADHPKDPGGATMKGVTLTTFRRYFGEGRSKDELREITDEQLNQIYRAGYWEKCHCNELPGGVDYSVFDAAVNSGPGRGAKWLQGAVGATQDGAIGAKTLTKVKEYNPLEIIENICDRRLTFLRNLSNWSTFGKGWDERVEGVRICAKPMTNDSEVINDHIPSTIESDTDRNGAI